MIVFFIGLACHAQRRVPVAELTRSPGASSGGLFEQEATEGKRMESVLCFLGYLLLNLEAAAFAPMRRVSFRVFRVVRGYLPTAVASPVVAVFSERVRPKILTHEPWIAEQITSAKAGQRLGFARKSRVGLRPRPSVAQFHPCYTRRQLLRRRLLDALRPSQWRRHPVVCPRCLRLSLCEGPLALPLAL